MAQTIDWPTKRYVPILCAFEKFRSPSFQRPHDIPHQPQNVCEVNGCRWGLKHSSAYGLGIRTRLLARSAQPGIVRWRPFALQSGFESATRHRPCPLHLYPLLFSMLAARASAARSASRIARSARRFATVVDSAGVKVAAADNGEATTAVTFLVKAGSRYEPKPGVAHALKNYAFKVRTRTNFRAEE